MVQRWNVAERQQRVRDRRKFLAIVGAALVDVGRLSEGDEANWRAIEDAANRLLIDYSVEIARRIDLADSLQTSDELELVPRSRLHGIDVIPWKTRTKNNNAGEDTYNA
jgi:hypothetical protein